MIDVLYSRIELVICNKLFHKEIILYKINNAFKFQLSFYIFEKVKNIENIENKIL